MEEKSKSGFIRDIVIKVFLILLFVFLITLLFPMPNLTPFYDAVFNNNIQTMKDAAENYFTKERMPENVGDSSKLTLKQMLDKKLVLPFLDEDGKECNIEKSYVQVTKKEKEYELKVYLSCGKDENYIITPIGCYNFCENNQECNCSCNQGEVSTDNTGKVTINKPVVTPDDDGKYKLQYLYTRTLTNTNWVTGNYQTNRETESDNVKLIDTKTEYTGKKKVESGSAIYKHVKYAYKNNWSYDTDWTDEVKTLTDNLRLLAERTLYTGQRKYTVDTTKYKHIKYGYKDNWTYDTNWTDEVKTITDNIKLHDERTLYTGQRKYNIDTTQYKHVKYAYKDNWTKTDWQTTKYKTSSKVVLIGTRYTVRKTINTGTWSNWIEDKTWRSSKPSNTSTKQWSDAYNKKTETSWVLKYSSAPLDQVMPTYSGNYKYDFLYDDLTPCNSSCNGNSHKRVYYHRVYEKQTSTQYQYKYRTYSSSTSVDERVVTDPSSYVANGYSIVKYEYKYKINNREKYEADSKWTDSKNSPSGYEYANKTRILRTIKYENLGKWVTSYDRLGEYTYEVRTRKQYKYKYNNPIKYIEDTIWTDSKNSPNGYIYANEKITTRTTKYENLGKWVTSYDKLGEYTYNVTTRKQYKYRYNRPEKYVSDTIWTSSITSPSGYTYTGESKVTSNTSYVDLGKWVSSRAELGQYTYDVETRKLYRYKYKKTTTTTESKWFDKNPGGSWVYANQTRKVKVN
ncbi:MAG: hypothetical protein J6J17_02220 [Bacilli bacterium]|nr:hypothetical protein [Bacilli bacterium]